MYELAKERAEDVDAILGVIQWIKLCGRQKSAVQKELFESLVLVFLVLAPKTCVSCWHYLTALIYIFLYSNWVCHIWVSYMYDEFYRCMCSIKCLKLMTTLTEKWDKTSVLRWPTNATSTLLNITFWVGVLPNVVNRDELSFQFRGLKLWTLYSKTFCRDVGADDKLNPFAEQEAWEKHQIGTFLDFLKVNLYKLLLRLVLFYSVISPKYCDACHKPPFSSEMSWNLADISSVKPASNSLKNIKGLMTKI